jgi:hypothetical protein
MIQLQQALENLASSLEADGKTHTVILGKEVNGMEVIVQGDICPAICAEHCRIHFHVQVAESLDAVGSFRCSDPCAGFLQLRKARTGPWLQEGSLNRGTD